MVRTGLAVLVVAVGVLISFVRMDDVDVLPTDTESAVIVPAVTGIDPEPRAGELLRTQSE